MNKDFHFQNRVDLLNQIKDKKYMLCLYSGVEKIKSEDENYDFQVNNNFYYLTGIKQPNVYLLIEVDDDSYNEYLFIEENNAEDEKWLGSKLSKKQASSLSKVYQSNIYYLNDFKDFFQEKLTRYTLLYLDSHGEYPNYILNHPHQDIYNNIIRLRMKKKPCEIKAIKKAIENTKIGIESLLINCHENMYEYQLEAYFDFKLKQLGQKELSFKTIAASGKNACILHYSNNNHLLKNNELVLFDLGCKEDGYCADISRSFPINGKFTPLQKKIYQIVLKANKEVIKKAHAKMSIKELQKITVDVLAKGCLKANLIKNYDEIYQHYYHGVSHSIGLDTHDPYLYDEPLCVNSVISNEPGLYFEEFNIGIRIEDDLLIKENKAINLSKNILKSVKDIETFMKERRK